MRLYKNKILVGVLTYKNPSLLERSLRSLYESEDFDMMDIIVIDNNNGADETSLICSRLIGEGKIKKYIRNSYNSIPAGYNIVIDEYFENNDRYDYVSFWCDDWAYGPGAFPRMIQSLSENSFYGCATAVSNYCSTSEMYVPDSMIGYLRGLDKRIKPSLLLNAVSMTAKKFAEINDKKIEESEFFCIGFLCKASLIDDIKYFNTDIISMNDVEYSIRAFKHGWKSIVCLDSYIHHIGMHAGWGQRPRQEHIDAEKNDKILFKTSDLYTVNDTLLNHSFWERKIKSFYE